MGPPRVEPPAGALPSTASLSCEDAVKAAAAAAAALSVSMLSSLRSPLEEWGGGGAEGRRGRQAGCTPPPGPCQAGDRAAGPAAGPAAGGRLSGRRVSHGCSRVRTAAPARHAGATHVWRRNYQHTQNFREKEDRIGPGLTSSRTKM